MFMKHVNSFTIYHSNIRKDRDTVHVSVVRIDMQTLVNLYHKLPKVVIDSIILKSVLNTLL